MTHPNPVDILWTGGWDSTYRVLDLVVRQGRSVRPHYVAAPVREGSAYEARAMAAIRGGVEAHGAGHLLAPLQVVVEDDIGPDPRTRPWIKALRARSHIGWQYEYLSRYARETLDPGERMELSIHLDDKAEAFLRPYVERAGDTYVLRSDVDDDPIRLFEPFAFPLLDLTKRDMQAGAEREGFADLMDLTWFCHDPRGGLPCGVCNPCLYTHGEGMGHRLPLSAHTRRLLRPVHRSLKTARRVAGKARRRAGLRPRPHLGE